MTRQCQREDQPVFAWIAIVVLSPGLESKPRGEVVPLGSEVRSAYFQEDPPYSQVKQPPPTFSDQFTSYALSSLGGVDRYVSELSLVYDVVERREPRKCRRAHTVELGHQEEA